MNMHRLRLVVALAALALLAAPAASAGGGIVVHGRWTIKVYDRHGHLVRARRFENSLQDVGKTFLVDMLGNKNTVGGWSVHLLSGSAEVAAAAEDAGTLVVRESTDGTALLMNGSVKSLSTASVDTVYTQVYLCGPSVTPGGCNSQVSDDGSGRFTQKALSPAIPVQVGQTISVQVAITFS